MDVERIQPELVIREEKSPEILGQINDDKEVGILVLGANPSGDGPGPLVSQLVRQGGVLLYSYYRTGLNDKRSNYCGIVSLVSFLNFLGT